MMANVDFGLLLPHGAASREARPNYLAGLERNLQLAKGHFTAVWMSDHLQVGGQDVMECWTTLAFAAGMYRDLHFGSAVLCPAH